ncbi:MAG: AMP-binding protein [Myxococcota bacterium]
MLYLDDTLLDRDYMGRCFERFAAHEVLSSREHKRIAVCVGDPAFWIAVCLFIKDRGGSVFPLPADSPRDAARRRAQRSGCDYLLFGATGDEALQSPEVVSTDVEPGTQGGTQGVLVQMSSGTTGEPKFVERTWASIDEEIEAYIRHFDPEHRLTPVVACPVTHSYGLICGVLVPLRRGVRPVVINNLNPKFILRKLGEIERPILYSSPTLIATLTMLVRPGQRIHAVMTSGTLMQNAWFDKVKAKVEHLHQQYGCSEAGCAVLGEDITRANELGKPLPHIQLTTGPSAQTPAEIMLELSGGKTVATADLGYLEGGKVHFVSRLDDMINVSGRNVYPAEVEEVILECPGVTDAVVYKRSHGFGNDQVCLAFASQEPITDQEIRAWCSERLAGHQVPMRVDRLERIPTLPNGKVSRTALAKTLA